MQADTYAPEKRTLGQLLSKTMPPLRVPDYQRDFSWEKEQVSEFWYDLLAFDREFPGNAITGREYFIGATVFVNNGDNHLVLDGQQRLATATILLAALRDKAKDYKERAGSQLQDQYIAYEDDFTAETTLKLELNVFDRGFFRDVVQLRTDPAQTASKRSHKLIRDAYTFLAERITEEWDAAGGGKAGFLRIGRIVQVLVDHVSVVAVISTDEDTADRVFTTLNDRGIGLSPADQLRSWTLQRVGARNRDELLDCWSEVFDACGTSERAHLLIRLSWVARYGDVKSRAIHKVIKEQLGNDPATIVAYCRQLRNDGDFYHQLRTGTNEDDWTATLWRAVRTMRAHSGYAPLLAANGRLNAEEQQQLAEALVALIVRHNVVGKMDRARFEATVFDAARGISNGGTFADAIERLCSISPSDEQFRNGFEDLSFGRNDHGIGQFLLRRIEDALRATEEKETAAPSRVHLEHVYPQSPPANDRWEDHRKWVTRFGNMTLLDHGLNKGIQNATFDIKRERAYCVSEIALNEYLARLDEWSPDRVVERQRWLCERASQVWPVTLLTVAAPATAPVG